MNIDYFGNEKYRILSNMAQREIAVDNENVVKLSQEELSRIVCLSKAKVNSIISVLKKDGYIVQKSSRGQYIITEKAKKEISELVNKEAHQ